VTQPAKNASRLSDSAAIRAVSLPKSLRGFDEAATRTLLSEVAAVVESLTAERESLRRQIESLQTTAPAEPVPTASRADGSLEEESPEALGNTILAAKRAGEELIAAAQEKADEILAAAAVEADRLAEQARTSTSDLEHELAQERTRFERERADHEHTVSEWATTVEVERAAMMAQARAEAESVLVASQKKLGELERKQEDVRRFISETRAQFVSTLESALAQLEPLVAVEEETEETGGDLPAALTSRVGSQDG
jgi:cell division septum initiation protein DivIVA